MTYKKILILSNNNSLIILPETLANVTKYPNQAGVKKKIDPEATKEFFYSKQQNSNNRNNRIKKAKSTMHLMII